MQYAGCCRDQLHSLLTNTLVTGLYSGFQFRSKIAYCAVALACLRTALFFAACGASYCYRNTICILRLKRLLAMSMSAEPGRKKAYSIDLRWRIVYQRIGMNFTYERIGKNLNISMSTAHRTYKIFLTTGNVDPVLCTRRAQLRKLDERSELCVIGLVFARPSLYLGELCQELLEVTGVEASPPTICRLLKSYGITRKKIRQVALQRCDSLRGAFMAHSSLFDPSMFVWIDETGSDAKTNIRKYGYALRGVTPVTHRLLSRGRRVNAMAAFSLSGLVALELTTTTVNTEVFFDYIRGSLVPNMLPFNGTNPKSIAIMDNLSVHRTTEVVDLFRSAGIMVMLLPPYISALTSTLQRKPSVMSKHI